jgi:[ribosomal protein S5]-alanine N-acetyltransferase
MAFVGTCLGFLSLPTDAPLARMPSRLFLRPPKLADERAFTAAACASRKLHASWTRAPETPRQFRDWLASFTSPTNHGLLVCQRATNEVIGVISITNIVLGRFRSGYLGYYMFSGFERQGLMTEAMRLAVRHAFRSLKLHRLEANIQPANLASIAVVRKCGFKKEGFSPKYLKIAGRWRDHERWAIVAP